MISQIGKALSSHAHIKKTQAMGENSQRRFYQSCKAAGRDIKKSSKKQDIKHIDFIVDGKTFDVKGIKPTHKKAMVVLEIKNVQGKEGWCSDKGPDYIAFDFGLFFVEVCNKKLQNLISKKCDLTNAVSDYKKCLYKSFTRKGRQDLITMVTLVDLVKECGCNFLAYEDWHEEMDSLL